MDVIKATVFIHVKMVVYQHFICVKKKIEIFEKKLRGKQIAFATNGLISRQKKIHR
jgi:hypothetical protein